MPVDKRKVTIKTLLISVTVPLIVFGIQTVIDGQTVQGGIVLLLGIAAAGIFVTFQEYDVPYESEIREVVKSADITTEDVIDFTGEISDQVDDQSTTTRTTNDRG